MGVFFFTFVDVFFMDVWSLEVTFSEILVSLGRLWTCLVPGGCREAMLSKCSAPVDPFWLHFGVMFGVKW